MSRALPLKAYESKALGRALLCLALLFPASLAQAQEIKKCVGKNGKITYSDQACESSAKESLTLRSAPAAGSFDQWEPPASYSPPCKSEFLRIELYRQRRKKETQESWNRQQLRIAAERERVGPNRGSPLIDFYKSIPVDLEGPSKSAKQALAILAQRCGPIPALGLGR